MENLFKLIKPLSSTHPDLSISSNDINNLKKYFGSVILILSKSSLDKEETLKLMSKEHYSDKYSVFEQTDFFEKISTLFSDELIKNIRTPIRFLLNKSSYQNQTVNGVFIFIQEKNLELILHSHTIDSLYNSGPQRVIWTNKDKYLSSCWFEIKNEKIYWPEEVKACQYYEIDTKIPHAGGKAKSNTIYFITVNRIFN